MVARHGSYRAAARALQIDAGYLVRLRSGVKTEPSATILRKLGLRRIVTYKSTEPTLARALSK